MNAPILFTPRLILRRPEAQDYEPWAAFSAEADTMRFLGGVQDRMAAWRTMCAIAGAWDIRGYSMFSVIERATGRWIGRIGPWEPEGWPAPEIGWGISAAYGGRGLAREAAVAAMDYAVDILGWGDVIHTIHPDNGASIALAERLGSTRRAGALFEHPVAGPLGIWGQTAAEWRGSARA
jgi:RimJ/RimL family protein N-acetyltransferase